MGLVFKVVLTGLAQGVAPPRVPARRREDREVRRPGLARHRALAPQFREQAPRTAVTAVSWASLSGAAGPAASLHRSAPAACVPPFSRARRFRPTLARSGKQKFPRGQLERSEQARKARRGFHLRRPRENYLSIPTLDGRNFGGKLFANYRRGRIRSDGDTELSTITLHSDPIGPSHFGAISGAVKTTLWSAHFIYKNSSVAQLKGIYFAFPLLLSALAGPIPLNTHLP